MKVKTELLQAFMQKYELSAAILAREMGVAVGEVEKLLGGTAVNEETANIWDNEPAKSDKRLLFFRETLHTAFPAAVRPGKTAGSTLWAVHSR